MVLLLRGCRGFSSARQLLNETVALTRSGPTRFGRTRPRCLTTATTERFYNSQWGHEPPKQKVVVVGIPNPFSWVRKRIYYFLIRTYFDKEFSIEEFTQGAKQAFSHVSRLLSECQFDDLKGLIATDLISKLEEKCCSLPSNYKKALFADADDIMYTTPGDVRILYDDDARSLWRKPAPIPVATCPATHEHSAVMVARVLSKPNGLDDWVTGRKFVSILMHFWYLTSAQLPDDTIKGSSVFKVTIGDGEAENKRLLIAIYEFQREFTKGVPPDWTITRVEHSKLLD